MKTLVVEDDFVSRRLLQRFLQSYGEVDIAVNGTEALAAFEMAIDDGAPYDLVCLDILLPRPDGIEVLKKIRAIEKEHALSDGCKVVMTSALNDAKNIMGSFWKGAEAYLVKPIGRSALVRELENLKLIPEANTDNAG